jgi:UDP-N-acetylmuramoylalanine--D-glutamate ligase
MSKRVVILGSGESGTGAAILAKAKGYEVFVSDFGSVKDKYKKELVQNEIEFEESQHTESKILNASLIIKSPGIPEKAEVVKNARAAEIEVIDEIEFAYRFLSGKIIAITGTNGKTTTTLLTYHLLKSAGLNVALAGNVGESLARKVAFGNYDWYVIEISSFQLDGTSTFRPDIGILLNITPDHLDRYEYKMENYIQSKFRLVKNMMANNQFIYYADDLVTGTEAKARRITPNSVKISLQDKTTPAHYDGAKMNFGVNEKSFSVAQLASKQFVLD